ncbi:PhlD [Kitasatospora sp. NPDC086009]|uniref:PhlD n=1 Tax=unclassified Kitasatospora TaxID=2633591 RepID=UPI0037C9E152
MVLPEHRVDRQQVADDVLAQHADHPRLEVIRRVMAQAPRTRYFSQPLDVVLSERSAKERNCTAYEDLCAMAERAARGALDANGLDPLDIDYLVTTHATGDAIPGLDIHLQHVLGLRPTVARRPVTQFGCGGGAHTLVMAEAYAAACPGVKVLVVAAESLSSMYTHRGAGRDGMDQMVYKGLWGDGAVAMVVSSEKLGPSLETHQTLEYVLPDTADRYRKVTDEFGVHFVSDRSAQRSIKQMAPALLDWLAKGRSDRRRTTATRTGPGRPWPVDFIVAHPGGHQVMNDVESVLSLPPEALRHSRAQFEEEGNLGGPSVLSVLARTFDDPPQDGTEGLLVGFGPGFTTDAVMVTYRA